MSSRGLTPFPDCLEMLPPLIGGSRPRELLVAMVDNRWTAYFDCGLRGTDAVGAVGYLSREVRCHGLAVRSSPHTAGANGRPERWGSVQFELFGPLRTEFINSVRSVYVSHDGSRWEFGATGTVQAFEETERYEAKRVRDRFTSEMLQRYCHALGVDVFNPAAYASEFAQVKSDVVIGPGAMVKSLAEVQQWLGIVPGEADGLPG